ncbi:hypothetical protein D9757_013352 [Collybiopsis confluens]|uniref:6-phosphogluconate dehydrogenase C-terminal domain-like protein n=1 Tax=Collybiopsis confluens TaxID=2823264 RepID=A0A8H5CTF1_9AGAR|nr:hypothetical protein D9757_013352 [Collybiopsis confluens]
MQDVLLVGFGAVGTVLSYSLHLSQKVRLTAVAKGNYKQIKNAGTNLKSERYGDIRGWMPDRVVSSVSEAADRQYSYVMLATKCIPDVIKTPDILKPLLSSPYCDKFHQPTYVLLQNGLNIERDLYYAIKSIGQSEPRIVSTGVYLLANQVAPNVVTHGPFIQLFLGVYRHNDLTTTVNSPQEQTLLENLRSLFYGADSTIFPEIQRKKFAKNMINVAFSGLSCLTRFSISAVYRPPPTDTPYQPYIEPATADRVKQYTQGWIRDILVELVSLDIENGYPIEVEVIWGELVRMAKERNVDIPRVEMSYAILVLVQNQILRQRNSKLYRQDTVGYTYQL